MWTYNYTNELYHHGVKGMKWGVRKAKEEYRTAKSASKEARKQFSKAGKGFGLKALSEAEAARKPMYEADMNTLHAKAKFKAAKAKSDEKAAKAEMNTYAKAMTKTGLVGSIRDISNDRASSRLYNELTTKKGKDYADRVQKKAQNKLIAQFVTATAVAIGASAVNTYLHIKDI